MLLVLTLAFSQSFVLQELPLDRRSMQHTNDIFWTASKRFQNDEPRFKVNHWINYNFAAKLTREEYVFEIFGPSE